MNEWNDWNERTAYDSGFCDARFDLRILIDNYHNTPHDRGGRARRQMSDEGRVEACMAVLFEA